MKRPSRQMPPFTSRPRTHIQTVGSILLCGVILAIAGYCLAHYPTRTTLVLTAFALVSLLGSYDRRRRIKRLAHAREGHTICHFSRSFDLRTTDPWIVRAVYEQLQTYLQPDHPEFPILATDRLIEDLQIDDDDLSYDLAEEIAQRAGRSLAAANDSSVPPTLSTVEDLVLFFNHLPRTRGH